MTKESYYKTHYKSVVLTKKAETALHRLVPYFKEPPIEVLDIVVESERGKIDKEWCCQYAGFPLLKKRKEMRKRTLVKGGKGAKIQKVYIETAKHLKRLKMLTNISTSEILELLLTTELQNFETKKAQFVKKIIRVKGDTYV